MSRSGLSLRPACVGDASALGELWAEAVRRAEPEERLADVRRIIATATACDHERILVAEHDGSVVGVVHLRLTTLSSLNLERTVRVIGPHVRGDYRRRGVGRQLMEAAVAYAESCGVSHVSASASAHSRDANRFMARLALGPQYVFRMAPTVNVRAKLAAQRPATAVKGRQITQVMAARRLMRRTDLGIVEPTDPAIGDPVG